MMGVNIYLLERHRSVLFVGGFEQKIGLLRRFWKITEMDDERKRELEAAAAHTAPSPAAVMIADVSELPLASSPDDRVKAHHVIGWDEGRASVTDFAWDYLPTLGYAVRDLKSKNFELCEERGGALYPIGREDAVRLGLVGSDGQLIRRGQPVISACREVKAYIPGYAEADCTFEGGRVEKILIALAGGDMPASAWVIGKKPDEIKEYPPSRPSRGQPVINLPHP